MEHSSKAFSFKRKDTLCVCFKSPILTLGTKLILISESSVYGELVLLASLDTLSYVAGEELHAPRHLGLSSPLADQLLEPVPCLQRSWGRTGGAGPGGSVQVQGLLAVYATDRGAVASVGAPR